MSLNVDKTCLFVVNFTMKHQFRPLLNIPGCTSPLDEVPETKLLGYWFTHDMKTYRNTEHILAISYKRIWDIYHPMLTKDESDNIERIQKIVLKIILGHRYSDYHQACFFSKFKIYI